MYTQDINRINDKLVNGGKTITTIAASLFAGSSKKSRRSNMVVYNNSAITVYYGDENVTTVNGMALGSGNAVVFNFDKHVDTDIYFVASSDSNVRVVEI